MSFLSLPAPSHTPTRGTSQPHCPASLRSQFSTTSLPTEQLRTMHTSPSLPHTDEVFLPTIPRRHVYVFEDDPFIPVTHAVRDCTQPPLVTLAIGTKVAIEGVQGTLSRIYGLKRGKVRFVLQPHDPRQKYVVLQVPPQHAKLPWHWQARAALLQLVGEA